MKLIAIIYDAALELVGHIFMVVVWFLVGIFEYVFGVEGVFHPRHHHFSTIFTCFKSLQLINILLDPDVSCLFGFFLLF